MTATLPTVFDDAIAGFVDAECKRWGVPGIAIGVLRDGSAETRGFGVASLDTGFPVLPETLFQAGSISKIVTTTLVMQLVDAGQIQLDAPVLGYLPSLRLGDAEATRALTMRHLLTHTGGFFGDRFEDHGAGEDALARAVAGFDSLRQYTPPGVYWAYNNLGFQLAGRIVEVLLERPFEALVRERVFAPAGMERTTYFADEAITYPVATGHLRLEGGETEPTHSWAKSRCRNPQGGVLTNAGDLLRFASLHLQGGVAGGTRVISAGAVAEMQRPQVAAIQAPHWGLGWWVDAVGDETIVGHGGVTNGFQAQLTLIPGRTAAFAFLSNGNQGGAVIRAVETRLLEHCFGMQRIAPPVAPLAPEELARLGGRYEGPLAIATVGAEAGGLTIVTERIDNYLHRIDPPVTAHAEPISGRRFRFTDGVDAGALFDFVDEPGAAAGAPPRYLRLNNRLCDRQS